MTSLVVFRHCIYLDLYEAVPSGTDLTCTFKKRVDIPSTKPLSSICPPGFVDAAYNNVSNELQLVWKTDNAEVSLLPPTDVCFARLALHMTVAEVVPFNLPAGWALSLALCENVPYVATE